MSDPTPAAPTKPNARAGRRFLALGAEQQKALADLANRYGTDSEVMAAFLKAALTPAAITKLVHAHLQGASQEVAPPAHV